MTVTTKSTDFASLAGSSLPDLGSGSARYRSLHELQAATLASSGGAAATGAAAPPPIPHGAVRLAHLQDVPFKMQASHTLQSESTSAAQQQQSTTAASGAEPTFRTPQERSDYHMQRIVSNLLTKEREETKKKLDEMYQQHEKNRHEKFIGQILSEIHGHRTLGGSSQVATAAGRKSLGGIGATSTTAAPLPGSTFTTATPSSSSAVDMQLLGSYLDVVKHWNRHWQIPLHQVVQAFSQVVPNNTSSEVWRLLEQILERPSMGALAHYCLQFQEIVQQRVRNAHRAGQDITTSQTYSNGMAQTVASYVKLTTTTSATSSMWATVYYCLRCGDAVAALNVLEASGGGGADVSALCTILAQWSQAQGNATLLLESTDRLASTVDPTAQRAVSDLYERVQTTATNGDAFYVATLALMSQQDPILDSPVIQTTEDYLFAWLWYVQSSAARRMELAEALNELGPSHFPNHEWGFALPLMAAQQYTSALEHLAKQQNEERVHAVHVALVLHQANLLEQDESSSIVTRLVLEHARLLQAHDAVAAVEYLFRIPDEQRRLKEIARLAVETNQLNHFPLAELGNEVAVSAIQLEASKQAQASGDYDMAARLLFDAGQYDSLLALLNQMLSSEMLKHGSDRTWRERSKDFHEQYLVNGQSSSVLRTLQAKGQQEQLSTFRLLLQINEAFELIEKELYDAALDKMDQLPLLPLTESECSAKARQYRSLDPSIKKVFPVFLESALHSLSSLYTRLGSPGYDRGSSNAERQRLRARGQLLLFSFSSLLHSDIPRDVMDRMATMERSMV